MKLLKDILYKAPLEEMIGSPNVAITGIQFDSRKVESYHVFVAVRGTQSNGHDFIEKAIEKGAIAVVCEEMPQQLNPQICYVRVRNSSEALAYMASNFYEYPSKELKLVGVTGTNGKTSTVTLLHDLFTGLGYKCGMLSTVVNKIGKKELNSTHTTPDAVSINALIREMVDSGCDYCFMEVSSHAIDQHRVTGLQFKVAVFTNITHDHLDYHITFDNYIKAKKALFDFLPNDAMALINKDDKRAGVMVQNTEASVRTYSLNSMADFKGKVLENHFDGLHLNFNGNELWTRLVGKFNASNLLAVYGVALLLKQDNIAVLTEISKLGKVEGRFESLLSDEGVIGIVDYAHTPDALKNVLSTIKEIRTGNEEVITLIGCGGDRDKSKRPEMAQIACEMSTRVILTSDNPRTENPDDILNDMKKGVPPLHFKKTLSISDRKEAIRAAVAFAKPGDIILVAGKGHEKYQEINGVKHPFDDKAILKELFNLETN